MTKQDATKLDVFLLKSLRRIMKIGLTSAPSVSKSPAALEVYRPHPQNGSKQTSQDGINMGLGGKAKSWQTQGDRWRRTAEKERTGLGFSSWSEATVTAWDRAAWRKRVSGHIPT